VRAALAETRVWLSVVDVLKAEIRDK